MKKYIYYLLLSVLLPSVAGAQTTIEEPVVRNQFTVESMGKGTLGEGHPLGSEYYDFGHSDYSRTAYSENKLFLRGQFKFPLVSGESYAENLDSALTDRAKVELLNMADRSPAGDLTWAVERRKIENAKDIFQGNINKITLLGGSTDSYRNWMERYNCILCAENAARNEYMPQGKRKEQYLAIYRDLVTQNTDLCSYLRYLQSMKPARDMVVENVGKTPYRPNTAVLARQARERGTDGWNLGMGISTKGKK